MCIVKDVKLRELISLGSPLPPYTNTSAAFIESLPFIGNFESLTLDCDIASFTDRDIWNIQHNLNNKPRKVLGYKTTKEVFEYYQQQDKRSSRQPAARAIRTAWTAKRRHSMYNIPIQHVETDIIKPLVSAGMIAGAMVVPTDMTIVSNGGVNTQVFAVRGWAC